MADTTQITLWFIEESPLARKYSKLPPDRHPTEEDMIWIPKSVIEHTSKMGVQFCDQHIVTVQDWFVRNKKL